LLATLLRLITTILCTSWSHHRLLSTCKLLLFLKDLRLRRSKLLLLEVILLNQRRVRLRGLRRMIVLLLLVSNYLLYLLIIFERTFRL